MKSILFYTILLCLSFSQIPEKRVVAEWEPAIGTMIRWPLGIPSDLVVELASDNIVYVLTEFFLSTNIILGLKSSTLDSSIVQ